MIYKTNHTLTKESHHSEDTHYPKNLHLYFMAGKTFDQVNTHLLLKVCNVPSLWPSPWARRRNTFAFKAKCTGEGTNINNWILEFWYCFGFRYSDLGFYEVSRLGDLSVALRVCRVSNLRGFRVCLPKSHFWYLTQSMYTQLNELM